MNVKIKSRQGSIDKIANDLRTLATHLEENNIKPLSIEFSDDNISVGIRFDDFVSIFQNQRVSIYSDSFKDKICSNIGRIQFFCHKNKKPKMAKIEALAE